MICIFCLLAIFDCLAKGQALYSKIDHAKSLSFSLKDFFRLYFED